jgi:quercetin dioxygenase-like cupin family protein
MKGTFMPAWIKWSEMDWEEVNEHISRKVVMEDRLMMVLYRFDPHQSWPVEIHEAEQGGYILQGKIELSLPAEGKKILLGPGDGYLIGTKVAHSWVTLEEETVLLDVFTPPRKELFQKKFAPKAME